MSHALPPLPNGADGFITRKDAVRLLPTRSVGAHKWGVGGVLMITGSPGYTGAAILSAMAAGRAGAGIVAVATSRGIAGSLAITVPEAITLPLGDLEGAPGRKALEELTETLDKCHAVVVGPGLGDDEGTDALMRALLAPPQARLAGGLGFAMPTRQAVEPGTQATGVLSSAGKPMVVDADALNWLAGQEEWWSLLPVRTAVLTPHPGEMARLTDRPVEEITSDPVTAARDAAMRWGQTVVLKHGHTVITDGTRTLVADDAPLSLATAGSGDVFAGMLGAFLAQGLSPFDAATLATHVGGRAARRVESQYGTLGVVAGDLPAAIAAELALLEQEKGDHHV